MVSLKKEEDLIDGPKLKDFNLKNNLGGKNLDTKFGLKQCMQMIDNGQNNDFKNFFNNLSTKVR